jgi:predicted transcriptional regulator
MTSRTDLYAKARRALERGDAASWEAAEAMAELADIGETQRAISDELGCSQSTVRRYLAIWRESSGLKKKPSFAEAMAELRPDNLGRTVVPKTPERRAELVAELLKDKTVADAPAVRQVQERHADRRLKAEAATFNREHGMPTRTETDRDNRRLSVVQNDALWVRLLSDITATSRTLSEATGEVERTGLPRSGSGEIIRKARALARAVERFEQAATSAGIGQAM